MTWFYLERHRKHVLPPLIKWESEAEDRAYLAWPCHGVPAVLVSTEGALLSGMNQVCCASWRLCTSWMSVLFSWSPSSGFYFYFFLFPIPTHALIAHWPPETPTSIREGTSWNVPPREHQRSNCPGGMGLMASELLQPELCMPMSWGYRQIVCAHECTLNMCLTRGFDQGWAEIHQQASCHFRFMVCTIKTGRVLFFFFLLKSTRVSNLFRAWWSGVEVLCAHCFFFLLCLIALLFSSGNRIFR